MQSEPYYDVDLDYVYFGSHDGALYCVRASDGGLVWRFMTGAEVARKPIRSGETLYVANGADQLFAIDRRSGKQRWYVHRTPAFGMEVVGYPGPAFDDGKIVMGYSGRPAWGPTTRRDGTERWAPVDLSAEAERKSAVGGGSTPLSRRRHGHRSSTQSRKVVSSSWPATRGVFALEAESVVAGIWSNDKAVGATDLTLWDEPAHTPSDFGPDHGG